MILMLLLILQLSVKFKRVDIVHLCMATNVHQDKIYIFIYKYATLQNILRLHHEFSSFLKILGYKEC